MPLTPVELYRAEIDPVRLNRELPPALSPATFCIDGVTKVSPFSRFGQLRLREFRSLCTSKSCSASAQHLLRYQVCLPCRAIRDICLWSFTYKPHVLIAILKQLSLVLPFPCSADAEPFCSLSRSCWSWGKSPAFLSWCLGFSTMWSPPTAVLFCGPCG